jgi:hypothetical protein
LFQQALKTQGDSNWPLVLTRYAGFLGLFLCAGLALFPGTVTALLILLFGAPFVFILFNGTIYGALWAVNIAQAICKEREQSTHDLLCISPVGTLGAYWLLGAGRLHRNEQLDRVHAIVRGILIIALATLGMIVLIILLNISPSQSDPRLAEQGRLHGFLTIASVTLALCLLYIDHIQSFVTGSIVGMMAPSYTQGRFEIAMWATGVFLSIQAIVYMLFLSVGISLTEVLFKNFLITGVYTELALSLIRVIIFYAIREVVITFLWKLTTRRLNASGSEFDTLSLLMT